MHGATINIIILSAYCGYNHPHKPKNAHNFNIIHTVVCFNVNFRLLRTIYVHLLLCYWNKENNVK